MPLYILTSKPGWKRKKHTRAPAWKPRSQPHDKVSPQPFYQVESPQEFDEHGNELGPDAQVWKTYVKETEQIDGEQVDAWNKLRVQVNGCNTDLSVAVTLTSMLAKEWCLNFMLGRTGPPGARARERQQRWDGIVCWKMEEVVMLLPSLIHMSLRLCIFLWDINRVVASPVIAVTAIVALAYLTCTVLPLVRKHCPYGTMISTFMKRSTRSHFRTRQVGITQDAITARALNWMIGNCQTPRSVDVALQSLAGATKDLPWDTLADSGIWSMIRHRLGTNDPFSHYSDLGTATYARALQQILVIGGSMYGYNYGSNTETRRLEVAALGLQTCIDRYQYHPQYQKARKQLTCTNKLGKSHTSIKIAANDVELAEDITQRLERHLNGEIDIGTTSYAVLSAILALLHTSSLSDNSKPPEVWAGLTDHAALKKFLSASHLDHSIFHNKQEFVRSDSEVQLGNVMCECLPSFGASNPQECAELVKTISDRYKRFSPSQRQNGRRTRDPEVLYGLLADHPFPKLSPDLVKLLISESLVSQLSGALHDDQHLYRGFAIAQLWFILHSSLRSKVRVYESLAALEATLVQDCRLQRIMMAPLIVGLRDSYLYRILECMSTKRDQPLTANAESWLRHVPNNLRGLASSVYLAGEEQ
ncbi:hypothetical protein RHS01_02273 [Rhizoctonia solani]|uniref:DUF6535 domain-containing protein n=1 Tax=Rhizoctonia solani TaxID=456999 RepID=A0A8H7IKV1_9AGAM|nr:hypothetical protein RHS01_02273 [Rhizoctonia solani]